MARATQAALAVQVAVFSFDPDPATAPSRALHVLTAGRALPGGELEPNERFAEAAVRVVAAAGVPLAGSRKPVRPVLHLVGIDDGPGRSRVVSVWYYATAPYAEMSGLGSWTPATGRATRLDASSGEALRAALERLRADTRQLAGASGLVGEVFTGDDLLRLHVCLHGGPEGSERTFRRRVQELRDSGVLRPVRVTEVPALRLKYPRFRSPAGTGGRPPELLRYSGQGGEDEQLSALRARRTA